MVTFAGHHTAKIDDKGRLIFPSEFRSQVPAGSSFVVRKSPYGRTLEIYLTEEWNKYLEKALAKINLFSREGELAWEVLNHDCETITPDEKMGRITISQNLLQKIEVKKEAVFIGQNFRIQVKAKENYKNDLNEDEIALLEKLLG